MIKALIIGETYGKSEEMFNHGFVGTSGRELARQLIDSGMATAELDKYPSELDMIKFWKTMRSEHGIAITNVFNLRPTDNNIDLLFTSAKDGDQNLPPLKKGKYLRLGLDQHIETLWRLIAELRPNLLICLGNTAAWAVLGKSGITNIRGTTSLSPRLGIKTICTYHPSGVLRQWNFRPIAVADLAKCKTEMEYSDIRRVERFILVEPTLAEIDDWFNSPADAYAVDIESGRALYTRAELKHMTAAQHGILNRQISMIGFARSRHEAIVIPFMTRAKPSLNYWDNEADEAEALRLTQVGLAKPCSKIFQNGLYDIPMLWSYGLRPRNCTEDTMLLHHALYSELPKRLGFLGSIYEDEREWKSIYSSGENLKKDE